MSPQDGSEPLSVESGMDLLVVLLHAPGRTGPLEPVDGITRLQKLVFLLQQEVGPKRLVQDAMAYGFKPYKMGPYAPQLLSDIEELKAAGILVTERLHHWLPDDADEPYAADDSFESPEPRMKRVESMRFRLAEGLGCKVGSDLWASLPARQQQALTEFKSFFNSLSLRQLLIFTYQRFPQFTMESTIKEQLGLA